MNSVSVWFAVKGLIHRVNFWHAKHRELGHTNFYVLFMTCCMTSMSTLWCSTIQAKPYNSCVSVAVVFITTSRGPHKHTDCVLHCVLLARWCPCLRWSCCRSSAWERLRRSGRLSPPTRRERRCRKTGKATLHQGSHEQYTSGLLKLYSFPAITMKDKEQSKKYRLLSVELYILWINDGGAAL